MSPDLNFTNLISVLATKDLHFFLVLLVKHNTLILYSYQTFMLLLLSKPRVSDFGTNFFPVL